MYLLYVFALGLGHVVLFPEWPVTRLGVGWWLLTGLGAGLALLVLPKFKITGEILAVYFAGTFVGIFNLKLLLDKQLPHSLDRASFDVRFEILDVSQRTHKYQRFDAKLVDVKCLKNCAEDETAQAWLRSSFAHSRVRLSWFGGQGLTKGEVWQAKVRLVRPRGLWNFGGFDYQAWLLSQGVMATGTIKGNAHKVLESSKDLSLSSPIKKLRQTVRENLFFSASAEHLKSEDSAFELPVQYERFYAALLLGDKTGLLPADWTVLQNTGTIHLMAISGLHVGLVAAIGFKLGLLLAKLFSLILLGNASRKLVLGLPCLTSAAAAFLYAALANFSIPTQRALIAVMIVNAAIYAGVRFNRWQALVWALIIITLLDPLAWLNQGFCLSFMAVFLLIYTLSARPSLSKVGGLLKVQVVLFVGLFLPLVVLGLPQSLISPIANLIAVPVIALVVVPALFIAMVSSWFGLHLPILWLVDQVFDGLWFCLDFFAGLPGMLWWLHKPMSWATVLAMFLGLALTLLPRGLSLRPLGGLLCVLALVVPENHRDALRLDILDVGQGLALVIESPNKTTVYDTGPAFSASFNAGQRIVWPHLLRRGVHDIDLIVSHGDNDHAGGAEAIFATMGVDRFLYGEALALARPSGHAGTPCQAGQNWQDGEVNFEMLWPVNKADWSELGVAVNANNHSCVILISYGEHKILLTGDIDKQVERALLELGKLPRNVSLLIAPHHGSKTSSSEEFIDHLNPEYVIFSAGYKNRYRHPNKDVVQRYLERDINMLNTAEEGALSFRWEEERGSPFIIKARENQRRLWH